MRIGCLGLEVTMTGLKRIILDKGIKQRKIADVLGVRESTVSRWVSGRSHPQAPHLIGLSNFLDVSPEKLLMGMDPMEGVRDGEDE